MPASTVPPPSSMRAVSPIRSASGFTCGLVTMSSGIVARRPLSMPASCVISTRLKRRAEMLHLVGGGHALDADEGRDVPIITGEAANDGAERTPVVELARREIDIDHQRRAPAFVEMIAVAR